MAPERSWEMESHGLVYNVMHNGYYDGKKEKGFKKAPDSTFVGKKLWFLPFWHDIGQFSFRRGNKMCGSIINNDG